MIPQCTEDPDFLKRLEERCLKRDAKVKRLVNNCFPDVEVVVMPDNSVANGAAIPEKTSSTKNGNHPPWEQEMEIDQVQQRCHHRA